MINSGAIKEYINENLSEIIKSKLDSGRRSLLEIKYGDIKDLGFDDSEFNVFLKLFEDLVNENGDENNHIYIQVLDIPSNVRLSKLDIDDVGSFISTTAMVKSITATIPVMITGVFECSRCHEFVEIETGENHNIVSPSACPSCGNKSLKLDFEHSRFEAYKILQLEEPLEFRRSGVDVSFNAYLLGFLASASYIIRVGDLVNITGYFGIENPKNSDNPNFFINLRSIKPEKSLFNMDNLSLKDEVDIRKLSQEKDVFNILVDNIAPNVSGNRHIKEGLVLQQFGAESLVNGAWDGERGTIHILLIGDPSLGKTKFLNSVCEVTPKYIRTGTGSTEAGLTASLTHEESTGRFIANAGAVVLADSGIICMDEFDKLKPEVQLSLNEPMESMTVSISKANITQTLSARTSFLCAANPKNGRFDIYNDIYSQINIPDSTITRFDLIYVMMDEYDETRDYNLMKSVLSNDISNSNNRIISSDLFMKYIAYAKMKINPKLTPDAIEYIAEFYTATRSEAYNSDENTPITMRDGRAIARLSIARAKCELREKVTLDDVKDAIRIYRDSAESLGLDLSNIGVKNGDMSKRELEFINTLEHSIREYSNSGIFTLDHELINEMKKDLMDKKGASKKEANRAFIKAYKNLKGSVFYG